MQDVGQNAPGLVKGTKGVAGSGWSLPWACVVTAGRTTEAREPYSPRISRGWASSLDAT